ncbi:MAG TPA: DNA ligase D [Thermoanaerobaculia bacterium]|nr:DNA ligase D [Thermoanaerobaculia bacterium]
MTARPRKAVEIEPQTPEEVLRRLFPPMLATLVAAPPRDEQSWVFEMKYDGFRAVAAIFDGEVALWSRNALDLSERFPDIFDSVSRIGVREAVLDGEIVVLDPSGAPRFQLIQRGESSRSLYFVFDLIWLEGNDLRTRPLEERRQLLETLIGTKRKGKKSDRILLAERMPGGADAAMSEAARRGYEGLIGKLTGSKYENRRSKAWIKLKVQNQQEVVVAGFTPSTASEKEIGSLLLAVSEGDELVYAGKVGTGFSAKQRAELRKELARHRRQKPPVRNPPRMNDVTWIEPRLVAQVRFTEWTSDGKLRHPSFLGFRSDKRPEECVREIPAAAPQPPAPGGSGKNRDARPAGETTNRPRATTDPEIVLTNPDRLLYPRDGITKRDVALYYESLAGPIMHALADRPLALEHWNDGIDKPSWFHQNIGREARPWMTLIQTPARTSDGVVRHFVADTAQALRWLAQYSVLTLHMWSSRGSSLESPDWVVFDLDPGKGKTIEQAVDTALVLRRLFDSLELPSVVKTSGKRGLHLFVPLASGYSHEEATEFACRVAEVIAGQLSWATVERAIAKRAGRLYLDCLQNGYGKTVVAPYSLRALDGAPVSAPLKWSEVTRRLDPRRYNLRTMPDRLARHGDLFRGALEAGVSLPRLR